MTIGFLIMTVFFLQGDQVGETWRTRQFCACLTCLLSSNALQWYPTPELLPGKSHGWRSLVGCSPWGREELDRPEKLHFNFSFSSIREGNGNPLQCSCLENPRDGGAWWAAVYGVAQSRTRLKQLSSSSNALHGRPCYCKWQHFILFNGRIVFHCNTKFLNGVIFLIILCRCQHQ